MRFCSGRIAVVSAQIQTLFVDDLDGSTAEGTRRFGLDGTEYEIDLNATQAKALRDSWHAVSVLPGGSGPALGTQSGAGSRPQRADWILPRFAGRRRLRVLRWRTAGRCPADLVVKFKAATGK